jgi:hypothetical protein
MNFIDIFSRNTQKSNFMKIRPVGAELFHVDGWTDGRTETDTTNLIFAFRNFATAPKEIKYSFGYRAHTPSNAVGTEGKVFLGIKGPRLEAPHLRPVPKLRINGAILPLPHIRSGHAKRQIYYFYNILSNK